MSIKLITHKLNLTLIGLIAFIFLFQIFTFSAQAWEQNSLTADPSFTNTNLSEKGKLWHDRLVRGYQGNQYIDANACSLSGDTYAIGRCVGTTIIAMEAAIRSTGDPQFVEYVALLMKNMRGTLKDVWRPECEKTNSCETMEDGYLNFTWKQDPNSSYYGTDWQAMDEAISHATIANGARIMKENISLHPEYQEEVNFWTDYLENHFIKKNKARRSMNLADNSAASFDNLFNRGLTHPDMSIVTFFYDLYKLTNNSVYLEVAQKKNITMTLTFREVNLPDGKPIYVWRQYSGLTKATGEPVSDLCQPVEYGTYTLGYVIKLHSDGFGQYAENSTIQKFANTIVDSVLANSTMGSTGLLARTVCGVTSFTQPDITLNAFSNSYTTNRPFGRWGNYWAYHGFARWDNSGMIEQSSEEGFRLWDTSWASATSDFNNPGLAGFVLYGLGEAALLTNEPPVSDPPRGTPTIEPSSTPGPTVSVPPIDYPVDPVACPADFNRDEVIDLTDVFMLRNKIRENSNEGRYDLNEDNSVSDADVEFLLPLFFSQCQS